MKSTSNGSVSAGITGDTAGETETMLSVPNHLETAGKRTNDMINPGTDGTDTMIRARALLKRERGRKSLLSSELPTRLSFGVEGNGGNGKRVVPQRDIPLLSHPGCARAFLGTH